MFESLCQLGRWARPRPCSVTDISKNDPLDLVHGDRDRVLLRTGLEVDQGLQIQVGLKGGPLVAIMFQQKW